MIITAIYLFNHYADCRGLISKSVLDKHGWTVQQAENEGLVIKEKYNLHQYIVTTEARRRRRKNAKH